MEFNLLGHLTRTLEPSAFMAPQTIIAEPPYLIVSTIYLREYRLLHGRLTNLDILGYVWNRTSSEKINVFHFSGSISKYAEHHFFLFLIFFLDRNGLRDALLAKSPSARRYLRTVLTDNLQGDNFKMEFKLTILINKISYKNYYFYNF